MNKSESIKSFAEAMAKFQGEVKNPPKTADNPFFKSKYVPLDVMIDTAKPILLKHGLSYIQSCSGDGQNIIVTTLLMHSSGEWVELDPLTLRADKATAQGAGSAITYGRRYALAAALGLASDEDDDGNHASKPSQKPQDQPKKIDETKVLAIKSLIEKTKSDEAAFLKYYKIDKIEDMTIGEFANAAKTLEAKLKREAFTPRELFKEPWKD